MRRRASLVLMLALLAGCGSPSSSVETQSPPSTALEPSDEDMALVEALADLARTGDPTVLDQSAFADGVALGLGSEILAFRPLVELGEPMGWRLQRAVFRAYAGPFSALDQLARDGEVTVSVGPHPQCASPPIAAPPGLGNHRRLSIQPASPRSCLQWWSVDLFVAGDGRVDAITLDLYEP